MNSIDRQQLDRHNNSLDEKSFEVGWQGTQVSYCNYNQYYFNYYFVVGIQSNDDSIGFKQKVTEDSKYK